MAAHREGACQVCGLIGYMPGDAQVAGLELQEQRDAFARLARELRLRGTHAYGIATQTMDYKSHDLESVIEEFSAAEPAIFHARYSTSGDWRDHANNQPIVVEATGRRIALALNGVIDMGTRAEMSERWGVELECDNDAEIMVRRMLAGQRAEDFARSVTGSVAAVWIEDQDVRAVRNSRRPLWICREHHGASWVASTLDAFRRAGFDPAGCEELEAS